MRHLSIRCWIAVVALLLPSEQPAAAADAKALEYALKANFLYKFSDYVSWPPETLGASGVPVSLCVVGDDPFGSILDDAVAGERVGDHPIAVRRMAQVAADSGCHILFTVGSQRQSAADALKAVAGQPVLTITENAPVEGAIITFVLRANRVRFEIDQQAASVNNLDISSKLLALAVSVRPRTEPKP